MVKQFSAQDTANIEARRKYSRKMSTTCRSRSRRISAA